MTIYECMYGNDRMTERNRTKDAEEGFLYLKLERTTQIENRLAESPDRKIRFW